MSSFLQLENSLLFVFYHLTCSANPSILQCLWIQNRSEELVHLIQRHSGNWHCQWEISESRQTNRSQTDKSDFWFVIRLSSAVNDEVKYLYEYMNLISIVTSTYLEMLYQTSIISVENPWMQNTCEMNIQIHLDLCCSLLFLSQVIAASDIVYHPQRHFKHPWLSLLNYIYVWALFVTHTCLK